MAKRERDIDGLAAFDAVATLLDDRYGEHCLALGTDSSLYCNVCSAVVDFVDLLSPNLEGELCRIEQAIILHVNKRGHLTAVDPELPESCPIVLNGVRVLCQSFQVDVVALAGVGRTLFDLSMTVLLLPDDFGRIRIYAYHKYEIVELATPKSSSRPPSKPASAPYRNIASGQHYHPSSLATLPYLDSFPGRYPTDSEWNTLNFNRRVELANKGEADHDVDDGDDDEENDGNNELTTHLPSTAFKAISDEEQAYWKRFQDESIRRNPPKTRRSKSEKKKKAEKPSDQ